MAAPREFDPASLSQVRSAWLEAQKRRVAGGALSQTSLNTYIRDIDRFVGFIGANRVLDEVSEDDIDEAFAAYAQSADSRRVHATGTSGKSAASVARYRAALTGFFVFAERSGYIQRNPMPDTLIKPARTAPDPSRTALALPTALALLEAPVGPTRDRDILILRILMETGVRNAELCAANITDVTVVDGVPWLRVQHGKGGKRRDVPFTPSTLTALHRYWATRPPPGGSTEEQTSAGSALFLTIRGRRIQPRDLQNLTTRVAKQLPHAQRRHFTPHALRHTMATLALAEGTADLPTVQRLLGHSSLAVTGQYLDEVRENLARAALDNPITGRMG